MKAMSQLELFEQTGMSELDTDDYIVSDWWTKSLYAKAEIAEAYLDVSNTGPWAVSYSGGKDSTVTLSWVMEVIKSLPPEKRNRKVYVLSSQTDLDLLTDPTKQREYTRIRRYIRRHNLPVEIVEVRPQLKRSMLFLLIGKGYVLPRNSERNRWCTKIIKLDPIYAKVRGLRLSMMVTGVRLSESQARETSIRKHQRSEFYGTRVIKKATKRKPSEEIKTLMPVIKYTLSDIWSYLANQGTAWGDATEISQVYKDATGECGLTKRKAGKGEDSSDACGARFGCVICPLVKIDQSTVSTAEKKPWYQPYVDVRNFMLTLYGEVENRTGLQRNGEPTAFYGGALTIKARKILLDAFLTAQKEHIRIATENGVQPQLIISKKLEKAIKEQWKEDENLRPYLADRQDQGEYHLEKLPGADALQVAANY